METLINSLYAIREDVEKNKLKEILFSLLNKVSYKTFEKQIKSLKVTSKPYIRHVLSKNNNFEVVLIKWNNECLPHNHSNSYGAIKILKGKIEHKTYQFADEQYDTIQLKNKEIIIKEDLIFETPELIHSLKPISNNSFSLHIYFKPISQMKVFNLKNNSSFISNQGEGAYLNSNILKIKLSDTINEKFTLYIKNINKRHNPYFCDIDIVHKTASFLLDIMIEDYITTSNKEIKNILIAINNANFNNLVTPIYITNGITEPKGTLISPDYNRGYDYGNNKNDRMKQYFYSEWWNWSMSVLLNYDNIEHPSEHDGNRFHAISPIPKEDVRLGNISSSSGGGSFPVHNDATAYNNFLNKEDFLNNLFRLDTNIEILSQKLNIKKDLIFQQVLCKQYVRADVLTLVGIINNRTHSSLAFPNELEDYLYSLDFTKNDIILLSKMPIAHFAGPADGLVSNYVANVKPPIDIDNNNNIISTFINAADNRMKYVGKLQNEEKIFKSFYKALKTMPQHKILLKSGDLLFIPNLAFEGQNNVMHSRDKIHENDYNIKLDGYNKSFRRYHLREYMSSRNRDNKKCFTPIQTITAIFTPKLCCHFL